MTSNSTLCVLTLSRVIGEGKSHQGRNIQFKWDDINGYDSSLLSPTTQVQTEKDEESASNLMEIIAKALCQVLATIFEQ